MAGLLLAGVALGPAPAAAEDGQERARRALAAGEIVPLEKVLSLVATRHEGNVLDVDLDHEQGKRWIYHVRVLTPDGRVTDLAFDARRLEALPALPHRYADDRDEDQD